MYSLKVRPERIVVPLFSSPRSQSGEENPCMRRPAVQSKERSRTVPLREHKFI
jgi:hypothetical protein